MDRSGSRTACSGSRTDGGGRWAQSRSCSRCSRWPPRRPPPRTSRPQCDAGLASQVLRTGKPTEAPRLLLRRRSRHADDRPIRARITARSAPSRSTRPPTPTRRRSRPPPPTPGPDDFNFTASDGTVTTPTYGFNLIITENHAPRCEPNGAVHTKVDEAVQLNVFCADQDAQDQDLTYTTIAGQGPDHGSLGPVDRSDGRVHAEHQLQRRRPLHDPRLRRHARRYLHAGRPRRQHAAVRDPAGRADPLRHRSLPGRRLHAAGRRHRHRPLRDRHPADQGHGQPERPLVQPRALLRGEQRRLGRRLLHGPHDELERRQPVRHAGDHHRHRDQPRARVRHRRPRPASRSTRTARAELGIFCTDLDDDPISYAAAAAPDHGASATDDGRVDLHGRGGLHRLRRGAVHRLRRPRRHDRGSFPVNVHAPEAPNCFQGAIAKSVRPGNSVRLELACTNPQGDTQTYTATTPTKGTLGAFDGDGAVTYTANAGASGTDTFTLRADNPVGQSDPQPVTITIDASFNRAPQCNENPFTPKRVVKNTPRVLDLGSFCIDPDGDPLVFERRSSPVARQRHRRTRRDAHLHAHHRTTSAWTASRTSLATIAGSSRRSRRSASTWSRATRPRARRPRRSPSRPGQAKSVLLSCSDPDAEQLTYRIVTPPSGTLSPPGDCDASGPHLHGTRGRGPGQLQLQGGEPGRRERGPHAADHRRPGLQLDPGLHPELGLPPRPRARAAPTPLPIATWCEDADGDPLSFTRAMPDPQHGTATASNGVITYTSDPGWTGPDSIGYVASDGHGGTVTQTFSVNVVVPVRADLRDPRPGRRAHGRRPDRGAALLRRLRRRAELRDHRPAGPRDARPAGRRGEPVPHVPRGRHRGR